MSAILLISHVFAMELDPAIKSLQGNTLAWYLVCRKSSEYESISFFAQTSRENNQLVKYLTQQNEKLLPKYPEGCKGTKLEFQYNRACCFAYKTSQEELNLAHHWVDQGSVCSKIQSFKQFTSFLPHNPVPFFRQGQLCFYGMGVFTSFHGFDSRMDNSHEGVVCYNLDGAINPCLVEVGANVPPINVSIFLSHKSLLQAILKSNSQKEWILTEERSSVEGLLYFWKNILIPHDYKEAIDFFEDEEDNFTLDELPFWITEPIEKRYAEQHNKDT